MARVLDGGEGPMTTRLKILWVLVLLLLAGSEVTYLIRAGRGVTMWPQVPLRDFRPENGFAYQASSRMLSRRMIWNVVGSMDWREMTTPVLSPASSMMIRPSNT